MKGCAPFASPEGQPPPPSADPLNLILFALKNGYPVQIVNFAAAVKEITYRRKTPPSGSCFHQPSGEECLIGVPPCQCGRAHSKAERCLKCGELVLWHDFPGRELRVARLSVEAPAPIGSQLEGPPEEQDCFVLIQVPRAAADAMDNPIALPTPSRLILPS